MIAEATEKADDDKVRWVVIELIGNIQDKEPGLTVI